MRVFVTGQDGRKYTGDVESQHKVKKLREQVAKQAGIAVEQVSLYFERQKVVVEKLEDDQLCADVGIRRDAELRAGFAVGKTAEPSPAEAAMADFSKELATISQLHADCVKGMEALQKKDQALVRSKERLQQRNGDKTIKDKIKIKTSTLQISTRRSILRFFPQTRLAALFSGCYDSEFLMLDGKPFLDINSECFRDLAEFLAGCKKASEAGQPLPALPSGPLGLEGEMAAMLHSFGITAAYELEAGDATDEECSRGGGVAEGQPPGPGPVQATEPEPQAREPDWFAFDIEAATAKLGAAMSRHRAELIKAEDRHKAMVEEFEAEQQWVRGYVRSREAPELSEVIGLEVGGGRVSTTRRVLTLCPESTLAKRFVAPSGEAVVREGDTSSGSVSSSKSSNSSSSSDEDEDDAVVIAESAYSFLKILDRLRTRATLGPKDPIPPMRVAPDKREEFCKVVTQYFPGQEAFILGDEVGAAEALTPCTHAPAIQMSEEGGTISVFIDTSKSTVSGRGAAILSKPMRGGKHYVEFTMGAGGQHQYKGYVKMGVCIPTLDVSDQSLLNHPSGKVFYGVNNHKTLRFTGPSGDGTEWNGRPDEWQQEDAIVGLAVDLDCGTLDVYVQGQLAGRASTDIPTDRELCWAVGLYANDGDGVRAVAKPWPSA